MRKILVLLFVLISFFPAMHFAVARNITIESPSNGEKVGAELIASGSVHNANKVWVIVHPIETTDYWVQPAVTVKDEFWDVQTFIGRPGTLDSGKHFEIMAIADPYEQLVEAQVFKEWPSARWRSQIISITRK